MVPAIPLIPGTGYLPETVKSAKYAAGIAVAVVGSLEKENRLHGVVAIGRGGVTRDLRD
jgi:hypothetical protein